LVSAFAWSTIGLLAVCALLLVGRRLEGALTRPLPSLALVLVTCVAVACCEAGGLAIARTSPRWSKALRWGLCLVLVAVAAALSLPGTRWPGLTALWLGPALACAWPSVLAWRSTRRADRAAPFVPRAGGTFPTIDGEDEELAEPAEGEARPLARIDRLQVDDRTAAVEGWVRAELATGQRTTSVHVAFCPPFARVPDLDFEQASGPEARIKLGQVQAYGARWEVKLAEQGPAEVEISFSARGPLISFDRSPPL
jgi:hypothetical protein